MRTLPAGLEINHAAGRVEQPRVCVPLAGGGRVPAIRTRQPFHAADRAGCRQFGSELRVVGVDGSVAADVANQVRGRQRVLGAPTVAVPHQPAAPRGDVAPIAVVAPGEGQCQRVFGTPHRLVAADDRLRIAGDIVHLQARTMGDEGGDVEAFRHGVRRIPSVARFLGRVQDVAGLRARRQDGLSRVGCVLPARLVAVRPDQHGLAGQRRPVGFLNRRVRPVHRRSGNDAGVNQGLGAFLALDQYDLRGGRQARLVVQRARLGRRHLAALGVPRPEFLASAGRVVAVHHPDQPAGCVQVVPLGRLRTEVVRWRLLPLAPHRLRADETEQVGSARQHLREFRVHVDTQGARDHCEHVPAITRGAIRPQAGLLAVEHDFQAVARIALDVADHELVPPLLAGWKQDGQHRVQPVEQQAPDAVPLRLRGYRACDLPALRRAVIEVEHRRSVLPVRQGPPRDSRS
ncbi:hypothetical protein GO296_04960 [Ralstonia solanacearum]|nr:hypothetical protein [Ralstonia solanacearum]